MLANKLGEKIYIHYTATTRRWNSTKIVEAGFKIRETMKKFTSEQMQCVLIGIQNPLGEQAHKE